MFDYFLTHATNCQKIENKPPCPKHLIALVWLVLGQVHYRFKKKVTNGYANFLDFPAANLQVRVL